MDIKNKKIIVGVSLFSPFVKKIDNKYSGFEIELWEKIAEVFSIDFEYREMAFDNLLIAVENKEVDVAIAGIIRTSERERKLDFSFFTLKSGLSILIPKKSKLDLFKFIKQSLLNKHREILIAFSMLAGLILTIANVFYFLERSVGTFDKNYFIGISESIWWTVVTITTVGYGDFVPHTLIGRFVGMFVIIIGYTIFIMSVAKITSAFSTMESKYRISSYRDLYGKRVATKSSAVISRLYRLDADVTRVKGLRHGCELLENKKVDAVVFDALVLHYFLKLKNNRKKFAAVGGIFAEQTYGFAFAHNSKLKELVDIELLALQENGDYESLHKKWFNEN